MSLLGVFILCIFTLSIAKDSEAEFTLKNGLFIKRNDKGGNRKALRVGKSI